MRMAQETFRLLLGEAAFGGSWFRGYANKEG